MHHTTLTQAAMHTSKARAAVCNGAAERNSCQLWMLGVGKREAGLTAMGGGGTGAYWGVVGEGWRGAWEGRQFPVARGQKGTSVFQFQNEIYINDSRT